MKSDLESGGGEKLVEIGLKVFVLFRLEIDAVI